MKVTNPEERQRALLIIRRAQRLSTTHQQMMAELGDPGGGDLRNMSEEIKRLRARVEAYDEVQQAIMTGLRSVRELGRLGLNLLVATENDSPWTLRNLTTSLSELERLLSDHGISVEISVISSAAPGQIQQVVEDTEEDDKVTPIEQSV